MTIAEIEIEYIGNPKQPQTYRVYSLSSKSRSRQYRAGRTEAQRFQSQTLKFDPCWNIDSIIKLTELFKMATQAYGKQQKGGRKGRQKTHRFKDSF